MGRRTAECLGDGGQATACFDASSPLSTAYQGIRGFADGEAVGAGRLCVVKMGACLNNGDAGRRDVCVMQDARSKLRDVGGAASGCGVTSSSGYGKAVTGG